MLRPIQVYGGEILWLKEPMKCWINIRQWMELCWEKTSKPTTVLLALLRSYRILVELYHIESHSLHGLPQTPHVRIKNSIETSRFDSWQGKENFLFYKLSDGRRYSTSTQDSFLGFQASRAWFWPRASILYRGLRVAGAMLWLPHMPAVLGLVTYWPLYLQ